MSVPDEFGQFGEHNVREFYDAKAGGYDDGPNPSFAHAAARTLALLNTAQADAFIAAWDAKFAYWSERPVQAIRRTVDPNWSPFIPTPPFPGYVSGHSTTSGAASVVLGELFASEARELAEMAEEAAISRLYGGIHYPIDNDTGLLLGRQVGLAALERH